MNEFKNYKRELIQINIDTVILLHIFEKDKKHSFEDIWLTDCDAYDNEVRNLRENAAKQFIKQFEGNECMSFIKALRDECNNCIKIDEENKAKMKEKYENRISI